MLVHTPPLIPHAVRQLKYFPEKRYVQTHTMHKEKANTKCVLGKKKKKKMKASIYDAIGKYVDRPWLTVDRNVEKMDSGAHPPQPFLYVVRP